MAADSKSARGSFPAKLYDLVEGHSRSAESEEDLVVSWCEGGLAFIVRDLTRFCEEVLPQHFCHNKWASFIRQLNLYGFRRITQGQSSGAYWHKYFQRGQPQLLRGITRARRTAGQQAGFHADGDEEDDHAFAQQRQLAGGPFLAGGGNRFAGADRGRGPLSATWGVGPAGPGGAPPMHSSVPIPSMPVLNSLSALPQPPIITDEALLRELDEIVQQQKAHHEKLSAPSPASSSNSLNRIRSDQAFPGSPPGVTVTAANRAASSATGPAALGAPQSHRRAPSEQPGSQRDAPEQRPREHRPSHPSGGPQRGYPQPKIDIHATNRYASPPSMRAPPARVVAPPPDKDDDKPEMPTPLVQPRASFAFPRHGEAPSSSGGDYAIGEDLAAAASAVSLNNTSNNSSSSSGPPAAAAPPRAYTTTNGHGTSTTGGGGQSNGNTPPMPYRRPNGSLAKKNSLTSFSLSPATTAAYNTNGPQAPLATTGSASNYEPATATTSTDMLSLRKRIASHQSVHSVGSLDAGSMTEIGGHPLTKRENMRTMSKSSLASEDWDLNIAEVDSLNFEEFQFTNGNLARQDSRDFLRSTASLNNASMTNGASTSSFGRVNAVGGAPPVAAFTARPIGGGGTPPTLNGPDLFSLGGGPISANGSPVAATKHTGLFI